MRFFIFNTIAMCAVILLLIYYYFAYTLGFTGEELSFKMIFFGSNLIALFLILNAGLIMVFGKKPRHSHKY